MHTNFRSDNLRFLRSWFLSPFQTGAQMPSGRFLSRAMAAEVDPQSPGFILELGPGTGTVTQALLARGIPPEKLILVEANPDFYHLLCQRFPKCRIILGDAFIVPKELMQAGETISVVVSSLPLMVFKIPNRIKLLRDCFDLMGTEGKFIQFTYATHSPIPLHDFVKAKSSERIWRNLWPAKVWHYTPNFTQ